MAPERKGNSVPLHEEKPNIMTSPPSSHRNSSNNNYPIWLSSMLCVLYILYRVYFTDCTLHTLQSVLYRVYFTYFTECTLQSVLYRVYFTYFTECTLQSVLYIHSVLYRVYFTECTLQSVLYRVYFTECTLHTQCTLQSVLYRVYFTECTLKSVLYRVKNLFTPLPLLNISIMSWTVSGEEKGMPCIFIYIFKKYRYSKNLTPSQSNCKIGLQGFTL
jgi:hypothetical protein